MDVLETNVDTFNSFVEWLHQGKCEARQREFCHLVMPAIVNDLSNEARVQPHLMDRLLPFHPGMYSFFKSFYFMSLHSLD